MATFFKNSVIKEIGITPVKVVETQTNSRATVIGLSLTNLTLGAILVSVEVQDDTSTRGYYCKDVLVPSNTSLRLVNGGEKLILGNSNELYVSCNTNNAVDALVSYVEIV
jgi:hypothetical protein